MKFGSSHPLYNFDMELASNGGLDQDPGSKMEEREDKPRKNKSVSFSGLFAAADAIDCFLMLFGSLGAFVHGAALPVFFVLFGRMIDSLGHLSRHPHRLSSRVVEVHSLHYIFYQYII